MALFGALIAHEDHARRAGMRPGNTETCGYKEELERRQGIRFRHGRGINTGLVVVKASASIFEWTTPPSGTQPTWLRVSSRPPIPAAL
jgi:hypothetical protein